MRVIAVDWSGSSTAAARHIWLAQAHTTGSLDELSAGRSRAALRHELLVRVDADRHTVIGLDFAFSFPRWYLERLGVTSAPALWHHVAEHGEAWLAECASPFWGRGPRPRPSIDGSHFRRTELDVPSQRGTRPKSVFQIGGAGAVGTGSIRGMPLLHALHTAGAHIWPFDPPGWPLVLEIYPRLLTGPVVKSNPVAREALLQRFPNLEPEHRRAAVGSEDAFDAAVSALVMIDHAAELSCLDVEADHELRLEGSIWQPQAHVGDAR